MVKKVIPVLLVLTVLVTGLFWLLRNDQDLFQGDATGGEGLYVVTTTTMATDMLRIVGGDRITVQGLMGPGVDPHSYQMTFKDTAALQKADLIFYSGLHLEGKMHEILERKAEKEGGVVALTDGIDKASLLQPKEAFEDYYDPHVWGNPMLWAGCLDIVVDALCEADPEGAEGYRSRAREYRSQLESLHEWVLQRVAKVPESQRVLVTSHDAFYYFGKTYGFLVKGLQGVSTSSESGLRDRAELVAFIKERKLKSIFPESSVNAKGIKAVADEAGVKVSLQKLFSDAMGKRGDVVTLHGETYDRGTYVGMIKHNVNTVVDGLR